MPLIQGYITVYDVWTSEAAWYLSHYHGYKDLEGINYIRGSVFAVSHVMASREVVMGVAKDGNEHHKNSIDLSTDWEVLGPFQIGTREATWGADPLEAQGGFRALEYDRNATFRSSLSRDGTVTWSHHQLERMSRSANTSSGYLTVSFPEVDWSFLQSVYGWGALQFQAWARGTLILNSPHCQSILLYTENLLEFWLDGKPYFGGDLYSYRRAPLTLPLDPGQHRLEVRLLRDVRVMGGIGDPIIQAKIEAQVASGSLTVVEDRNIFPDIVDGKLPSNLGSIPVRNESLTWIHILGLESADDLFCVALLENASFSLAPGQTRPLPFDVDLLHPQAQHFSFKIKYAVDDTHEERLSSIISLKTERLSIYEPHKFTFMHSGGIVSYAILRPPSAKIGRHRDDSDILPVLLNLHGAGLEADSDQVRHTLDILPDLDTWVLYPTGVTSWCADDWHTWGFADVEAAVEAIPLWVVAVGWKGPSVNTNTWLVSGHSNGGQGVWYALAHRPDKIVAAVAVSGYSSIQAYVPYQFWHEADPFITAITQASMNSYRHELLVENFAGIPVLQQHGSADDNVPAYHSRRLNQLISNTGGSSEYVELQGAGHWFDGVMTTRPLRDFYLYHLAKHRILPALPLQFSIVVANPAEMGSRGGIVVDQLIAPEKYGRVHVERIPSSDIWILRTRNILRFHLSYLPSADIRLQIDDSPEVFILDRSQENANVFSRLTDGLWQRIETPQRSSNIQERRGRQLGALTAILNSHGRFTVLDQGEHTRNISVQITRNLFQYFAADSMILDQNVGAPRGTGNVIRVALGSEPNLPKLDGYPISIDHGFGISVRDASGNNFLYAFEEGLGAVFLRPMSEERLELIIWGADDIGLRQAARLVPMLTGVGQADFVILSKKCLLTGAQGVLAMGFFDHRWNVTRASYLT